MGIELTYVLLTIAIISIIVSLIMSPSSNSFSGAIVGSSDLDLFKQIKERGFNKWIKRLMLFLGFSMMILSIVIRAVN